MKIVAFGYSNSVGLAKSNNEPYDIKNLFVGKPIRQWKTDKGVGEASGHESIEIPFQSNDELLNKIKNIAFPALVELKTEPLPEDPTKNIIIGLDVICTLWDSVPHNKK
ncbi:RstB2 protein [Aliivibrio fischeri ES114]|uniref:RstB2 protein n=1 Tax=Aliivibrio fischeri (strain ATCC 700601 / ES114) TaxID=312309 RepID=Q5DZZ6_ALIF1|nr:RstB2 protein [Aliivibrio fischeri]AAW87650.1 RstB2 protein [Aliivibrio fischeri ES114]KLU78196.1 hypothetical protein AB192_13570 [Aliivibrio fischeri]